MDRDNPWIALLKVWIRALRGQSMDCSALARSMDCATTHASSIRAKEEEREQGDQSGERKVNRGLPFGWRPSLQVLGGFRLLDYSALGLRNVLCLPAKKTLWSLDCTLHVCD